MNYVSFVLGLLNSFLGNNPTFEEIEQIVPQILAAFDAEKNGKGFSVTVPISIGGVKQSVTVSATPVATTSTGSGSLSG